MIYIIIWLIVIYCISVYNKIIWLINSVNETLSSIDVYLKNRFDLIPNLVEIVRWYSVHETNIFELITTARNNYLNSNKIKDKVIANDELSWSLNNLFAISEDNPELKASDNYINLQNQLIEIEDRIAAARRTYNSTLVDLLNLKQKLPSSIIAYFMKIPDFDLFNVIREERKNIVI